MADTLAETFGLAEIVRGLAMDAKSLREGTISVDKAKAQAELAKQIFNGLRLVVTANKYIESEMKRIGEKQTEFRDA